MLKTLAIFENCLELGDLGYLSVVNIVNIITDFFCKNMGIINYKYLNNLCEWVIWTFVTKIRGVEIEANKKFLHI